MNKETNLNDVIAEKLEDLMIPGFIADVTPIEADTMGAFSEDALSAIDAQEAVYD
ncbi:hypothetical protein [Legionella nagasakiensis]|uniref:hypothetical protein n=1 Tax=Legionella nagasakiensis TaxID=535290 RepID=UPI0013EF6AD1|nr:hypothetical protein [Legionella nagasakiensis]